MDLKSKLFNANINRYAKRAPYWLLLENDSSARFLHTLIALCIKQQLMILLWRVQRNRKWHLHQSRVNPRLDDVALQLALIAHHPQKQLPWQYTAHVYDRLCTLLSSSWWWDWMRWLALMAGSWWQASHGLTWEPSSTHWCFTLFVMMWISMVWIQFGPRQRRENKGLVFMDEAIVGLSLDFHSLAFIQTTQMLNIC